MVRIRFLTTCAFILFLNAHDSSAQGWETARSFSPVRGLNFQWRRFENLKAGNQAFIEWMFTNSSDSIVSSLYRVLSDSGEERVGKIILNPHAQRLSGWYFTGDRIERLESTGVTYRSTGGKSP